MIELLVFLFVTAAIVTWWHLMQGRQRARQVADQVCSNHALQLLDDTVSLKSITWDRTVGNNRILVNYQFEFATNGAVRRTGMATLGLPAFTTVTLDLEEGRLIENVRL